MGVQGTYSGKENKMGERAKSIVLSYIHTFLTIFVNLVYAPILLKIIGQSEYGLYQLVASFFGYIAIFETSISTGVLKFFCEAKASKNQQKMENILAVSQKIYQYFSCIISVVGALLILLFRIFYKNSLSDDELTESCFMFVVLIVNIIITMNNAIYISIINAYEKFIFLKGISIISQLVQPVICVVVLLKYPYAFSVVIIQLIVNIVVVFARWNYVRNKIDIKIELHEYNKNIVKGIIIFAGSIILSSIADQIFWKTDQIILGKLFSTKTVAVYSIGAQIFSAYMAIGISISSVFFPKISSIYGNEKNMAKISQLFVAVGKISYGILLLVFSGFLIFGKEFLIYWVGRGYEESYYIAIIIMFPYTAELIQNLGLSILQVMNKYSFRAKLYFVSALINVVMTCFMARAYGCKGAALSTAITIAITSGVILNIYYKYVGIDIKMFWKTIMIMTVKIIPIVLVAFILNLKIKGGLIIFGLKILAYIIVYLFIIYSFVVSKNERENLLKRVRKNE